MRISDWSSDVCSSDLIHDLLMALPPSSSVSITRPDELAKELFTHRGSGTLVRRGEKIRRYGRWKRIDLERLTKMIESGFGRTLAEDYLHRTNLGRAYARWQYRTALRGRPGTRT